MFGVDLNIIKEVWTLCKLQSSSSGLSLCLKDRGKSTELERKKQQQTKTVTDDNTAALQHSEMCRWSLDSEKNEQLTPGGGIQLFLEQVQDLVKLKSHNCQDDEQSSTILTSSINIRYLSSPSITSTSTRQLDKQWVQRVKCMTVWAHSRRGLWELLGKMHWEACSLKDYCGIGLRWAKGHHYLYSTF